MCDKEKVARCRSFGINCGLDCFYRKYDTDDETKASHLHRTHRRWMLVLMTLFMFECYYNLAVYYKILQDNNRKVNYFDTSSNVSDATREIALVYYRYPLNSSAEALMDYKHSYNSSYYWFMAMNHLFKNLGDEEALIYPKDTPDCRVNVSSLGPILVNKTEPELEWIQKQNRDVKMGGYYAPAHCRATHRVAIIVPYRDRRANLATLLRYLHPFQQKQQLEYRIFVIEQYGKEQFNKGTLYNIAFLETQRFGIWNCLIFHDADLIPEDERISYTCQKYPTHMSASVESHGYVLPYSSLFGGVTSLTPHQYECVNGYSNFYWSWGAEDDDMSVRLQSANLPMLRYNSSIARYATLPHVRNQYGQNRYFFLAHSKLRYRQEGLTSTKYNLITIDKELLYTHILADVNPIKMKLQLKSMLRQLIYLFDNSMTYAGIEKLSPGRMVNV